MKEVKFIQKLIKDGTPFLIMKHQIQIGAFAGHKPEWIVIVQDRALKGFKRDKLIGYSFFSKIIDPDVWVKSICKDGFSAPNGIIYDFNGFKESYDEMLNNQNIAFS